MSVGVPLSDGYPSVSGSMLVAGRVHRPPGPWTASVVALLRHLEDVGFDGAPRFLGYDDEGREVLTWVEGEAPTQPWPEWMRTDAALAAAGGLLRRYHDAAAGFVPPPGARWRRWMGSRGGPIIRHGDLWPSNVVCRGGLPVALIDWEFAQPGTELDDLASLAAHWVPLMSEERAAMEGWTTVPDRVPRLQILCSSYGLPRDRWKELIPAAVWNLHCGYLSHKAWGEAGVQGFAEMWRAGSGTTITANRVWLEAAAGDLRRFAP